MVIRANFVTTSPPGGQGVSIYRECLAWSSSPAASSETKTTKHLYLQFCRNPLPVQVYTEQACHTSSLYSPATTDKVAAIPGAVRFIITSSHLHYNIGRALAVVTELQGLIRFISIFAFTPPPATSHKIQDTTKKKHFTHHCSDDDLYSVSLDCSVL